MLISGPRRDGALCIGQSTFGIATLQPRRASDRKQIWIARRGGQTRLRKLDRFGARPAGHVESAQGCARFGVILVLPEHGPVQARAPSVVPRALGRNAREVLQLDILRINLQCVPEL